MDAIATKGEEKRRAVLTLESKRLQRLSQTEGGSKLSKPLSNKNYLVVLVNVSLSVLYIDSILAVLSCFWEATIANICQAMTHHPTLGSRLPLAEALY